MSKASNNYQADDGLPNNLSELEALLSEIDFTFTKLKESTNILTEEFRVAQGEEAREYYEYIQDNMEILKSKEKKMTAIRSKINQIRGTFPIPTKKDESSSSGAGGVFGGHLI